MGNQLVFHATHCPDIRKRFPQVRLSHRWLTPPTRQAPMHSLFEKLLKIFLMRIAAVAIQRCQTNSLEDVYVPRSKKHPHLVAFLLKFHAAAPMRPCLNYARRQNPRIHPIQDDGLKKPTNWIHTGHVEDTEQRWILTKTSSRDHVTSTFTRTAERVNSAHSW